MTTTTDPQAEYTRLPDGTFSVETGTGTALFAPPLAGATGEGEAFTPTRVLNRALNRRFGFAEDGPIPWHNMTPKVVYDVALDCLKGVEGQLLDGEARAEAAEAEATALRTRLQEAEEAGAAKQLVGESAALFAHVREKYADAGRPLAAHADWFRLCEVLDHAEAALTDAAALRAKLATEDEQHKAEVLGILRDLRLPRLSLPDTYGPDGEEKQGEFDMICGQNKERQAINHYCRTKAYEYSPEGIGPDPVKPGEWDTLPKNDDAGPLLGDSGKEGDRV